MLAHAKLKRIAARHKATPAQIALAWLLRQDVVAIPKASNPEHVRENRAASDLVLTPIDLREIDAAFPPPRRKVPLAMN
jgi:diketogulonate reductase-like aldo/keto reductase